MQRIKMSWSALRTLDQPLHKQQRRGWISVRCETVGLGGSRNQHRASDRRNTAVETTPARKGTGGTIHAPFTADESSCKFLETERSASTGISGSASMRLGQAHSVLKRWRGQGTALLGVSLAGGFLGSNLDLSGPASVAQALGVLAVMLAIHEAGHFVVARAQGIHVDAFAVGFGPKLLRIKGPEVEYSLRAIPLGGYTGFPDDTPGSGYSPDDPNLLCNRSITSRALVTCAGVLANTIFAYTVLVAQVSTVGFPNPVFHPGVMVPEVVRHGAADRAGLRSGDLVTAIAGRPLPAAPEAVLDFLKAITENTGREVELQIERNGRVFDTPVVPQLAATAPYGDIGVKLAPNAEMKHKTAHSMWEAANLAGEEFQGLSKQVTRGLKRVLFNSGGPQEQVAGPVAVVAAGSQAARTNATALFHFAAIVSINLAVVNALPLPALDGGYMALLLLEVVRKKRLDSDVESAITGIGVVAWIAVGMYIFLRDVTRVLG